MLDFYDYRKKVLCFSGCNIGTVLIAILQLMEEPSIEQSK